MKYYVLDNKKDVIYCGNISKNMSGENGREYNHNIKSFYKKNANGVFEEFPNNDLNIDLMLTKKFARGLVKEYPTLEAAKRAIGR